MDEPAIREFMVLIGTKAVERRNDWVVAACPLAFHKHQSGKDSRPSFAIKIEATGTSVCNCFACNVKGELSALLFEIQHALKQHAGHKLKLAKAYSMLEDETRVGYAEGPKWGQFNFTKTSEPVFEPWPEWWLDDYPSALAYSRARDYLNKRAVPEVVSDFLDLRYDVKHSRVGFPFRDSEQVLAGMRGRSVVDGVQLPHYDYSWNDIRNSGLVWLGEHWINWQHPVVVVEGQFDLVNVFRSYRNVLSNFTASMSYHKTLKLANAPLVLTFTDNDAAGLMAHEAIVHCVGKYTVVRRVVYPVEDKKRKDPGMLAVDEIQAALVDHVELDEFITMDAGSITFPFDIAPKPD